MNRVPINEAEAILEPFWDGGSSEHPDDKRSLLDAYTVTLPSNAIASIKQIWCALQVQFEQGAPGSAVTMTRKCDIEIAEFDTFRVFASIPSWVALSVRGTIDGRDATIIDRIAGANTNDEFDGDIKGKRMTSLTVEYRLTDARPVNMQILWFGLANSERQREMEAAVGPYTDDWQDFIRSEAECRGRNDAYQPCMGIMIDSTEIERLRRALYSDPLAGPYRRLLEQAKKNLNWEPEKDIGRFIPKPDRRWVRNRDMSRLSTAGVMELLAFTGIIERDYEMIRMACRMALSASHCEYWSESIIGTMPGTTWHHRSFTEEIYCRACALVLDWAGFALTGHAKQLIRDAIIMKGLPRIESDFKRMEYIRHMNQGIVFSSGRIIGTLALLDTHPRYKRVIDEAEQDLHEMIDSYVHEDGGTLEGMAYWSYTFSSVMPVVHALARHRGKTMAEYASEALRKTGDFGLGMLSTLGRGETYLPVNDAHAGVSYPLGLLAAYTRLSTREEWRVLYELAGTNDENGAPDLYHLLMAPRKSAPAASFEIKRDRFDSFAAVGQMSSVRTLDSGDTTLMHLCSGPTDGGHYHEDKGSIIVEAGGEALAFDRGVTDYHHPEVNLIGMASRHNLVYPESADGRFVRQPRDRPGGTLTSALWDKDVLLACSDNREAWEAGLFAVNFRRICSPAPEVIVLDDELILGNPMAVSFRINSLLPVEASETGARVCGLRYTLEITPLNWVPEKISTGPEGLDSHLDQTNVIQLHTGVANRHRLITLLEIHPTGLTNSREVVPGEKIFVGGAKGSITIHPIADHVLNVAIERQSRERFTCECNQGTWRLGS